MESGRGTLRTAKVTVVFLLKLGGYVGFVILLFFILYVL